MLDRHHEFLIELAADKTPHSGRTLLEHLKGVHDLLRDWDNDDDVCLAGFFHSIYGTNTFEHISLTDRGRLIGVIGPKAELLVHYFSVADRPLFESIGDNKLRSQLMEIEVANLIEQGGSINTLRKLSRMKGLSNGAKAALAGEVG